MKRNLFRAWDKKENHFVYFEIYDGVNKHTPPIYSWAELEPWEQFTGSYDCNDGEIFENDFLEPYEPGSTFFNKKKSKVFWKDSSFNFHPYGDAEYRFLGLFNTKVFKIVGNTHEN